MSDLSLKKPKIHLLVSVYLSPIGLGKYRLGYAADSSDEYFRISRFLTSTLTLSSIDFESVHIYFDTAPVWSNQKDAIQMNLKLIFPQALIFQDRLLTLSQWKEASKIFPDQDYVLLQNNDDHAFVEQVPNTLSECLEIMSSNLDIPLCGITHFPEMEALKSRYAPFELRTGQGFTAVPVTYAVGTTLVASKFLKSWWENDNFEEHELIAKPDNPLGKSVEFPPVFMLIPKFELMRHMDGYSHIQTFRPLAPLRNLLKFNGSTKLIEEFNLSSSYRVGFWPSRIYGYSGHGVDIHQTYSNKPITGYEAILLNIAVLQSMWALRISFSYGLRSLRNIGKRNILIQITSIFISLFTPSILRNIPDWLTEKWFLILIKIGFLRRSRSEFILYKGPSRTLFQKMRNWNK